ncbi:HNH endonuclease [Alkalibacillus almallahensis]|uniref:HNH endonuclease n=1 Tax=Alkalibacillus almallahensis TaxID=1379154 RepID=UPI001424696A|nr:HNH endonuclease [Alkalibacillus almallahensis]
MPQKAKKPCKEVGCNNLTRETYCKNHEKNAQEIHQDYNRYKRNPKLNAFYQSKEWKQLRRLAYDRDNGLCQSCKRSGILKQANVVHHIVEIAVDYSLRLTLGNLESLCHACHNRFHKGSPDH